MLIYFITNVIKQTLKVVVHNIDFPAGKKKEKINNDKDRYFQYAATIALNYEKIESRPETVSNIKPFTKIITGKE